jgi:hypothetical protein
VYAKKRTEIVLFTMKLLGGFVECAAFANPDELHAGCSVGDIWASGHGNAITTDRW